ncbi:MULTISPECIES: stalk domain-containing protein [Paenibacillus]|uniref:Stalk domain-containing protein n=1 Tax=Paenibacillus violae TaxID=3077234 RepID=A0ABU3RNL9_9BACL|nr:MULTISPECIES: stalk domain-containing protein [Paenibacillus]MDU0205614.1 stalk domain-containing protein [Paenibacillus sp. PFR10]MEC0267723.1 stalk domain-containing protein [Paenibacillus anseongense]
MKKKKLIVSVLAFFCLAGVVHAAGLHGDYKGAPIVKVLFGGKELQAEDVPATIQDGRTVVPLYLLKQTGASVTWDAEKYTVDFAFPQVKEDNAMKDFAATIPSLNEKAKEFQGKNVQLIYNEYGLYLKVDLEISNDTSADNDHIIALSGFLVNSPVDSMIVSIIYNNLVTNFVTVKRSNAEEFSKSSKDNLSEYHFMKTWNSQRVDNTTDVSVPNKPQPTPTPLPVSKSPVAGPACQRIIALYTEQINNEVNQYNANLGNHSGDITGYADKLKENMKKALKENNCPED